MTVRPHWLPFSPSIISNHTFCMVIALDLKVVVWCYVADMLLQKICKKNLIQIRAVIPEAYVTITRKTIWKWFKHISVFRVYFQTWHFTSFKDFYLKYAIHILLKSCNVNVFSVEIKKITVDIDIFSHQYLYVSSLFSKISIYNE